MQQDKKAAEIRSLGQYCKCNILQITLHNTYCLTTGQKLQLYAIKFKNGKGHDQVIIIKYLLVE